MLSQKDGGGGGALPKKQVKKKGKKQPPPSYVTTPTPSANVSALPPPPSPSLPPPQPPSSSLDGDGGVCAHAGIDLGGDDDDAATQASERITARPMALDLKNRVKHQHVTDDARDDDDDATKMSRDDEVGKCYIDNCKDVDETYLREAFEKCVSLRPDAQP